MESLDLAKNGDRLEVLGIPEAVKIVEIRGSKAQRLADLTLHRSDLRFAAECLDAARDAPAEPYVIKEALWRSAIIHFAKCFRSDARCQLSEAKIYRSKPPEAIAAFEHAIELRNKHVVHDENSFNQCLPGAAINAGDKAYKVEKIVCLSMRVNTYDEQSWGVLRGLVDTALEWVESQFDQLCGLLTKELELETYNDLAARPSPVYAWPDRQVVTARKPSVA